MISRYLDPKNDLAFKKIFGEPKHEKIPIAFLNAVFRLTGSDAIVALEFLNPIQPPEVESRKESIVDVLVRDSRGSKYIIEMQVVKVEGFEKRAQFYAAKTYCSHFNKKGQYEDLTKVIFLAITAFVAFPEKSHYKSDHVVLDRESLEHDLKDFSFTFVELPKFNKPLEELKSLEDKWYYFLKHADESSEIAAALSKEPEIREAYAILDQTYWTESQLLEYDRHTMAIVDAKGALTAARKDGHQEGRLEGRQEGLVEGIEKGRVEERRAIAKALIKSGLPLEEISKLTGLSLEEIKNFKDPRQL